MSYQIRLKALFDQYLQRNCSPQEVEELISLLNQGDAEDILDAPMRAVWEQHTHNPGTNPVDWAQMYAGIISSKETLPAKPKQYTWIRYAAAAVLLPLLGVGMYWLFTAEKTTTQQEMVHAYTNTPEKKQATAAKQTIHLPDGSTVILNEGSRLNYPSAFTGKTRNVYLTGEGFFDIQHNPQQPFIVHSGKVSIKVLGTAFNVKTMPLNQDIEVTVTRGKVQVLNEEKSIGIITASQQILYAGATGAVTQATVDTIPVLAWKPAEIVYNDISMEEVAIRMEKRFAVTIEFANPAVKNCRVSATFYEDDLPEEILAVVCAVSKSEYIITNKKIIINGKGCN